MTTFTRTVDGRELPVPGTYAIDVMHSSVAFEVKHLGFSKVRGRFTDFEGTIAVAEEPQHSSVEVTIQADSVDTAQAQRDAHLRSTDFFGVEDHPTFTFSSTGVEFGDESLQVHGDLTIHGKTRPVVLDAEFDGACPDPMGDASRPRIGFSAATTIDRYEFGITFNQPLETGALLLSKLIRVELDVQAVRR
ncbi:YceI family protein [Actinopolymorpha rutila]|uniref:Polyisoprenoid-binding protein YceI n=1 Tax=Actinopolymorpha rutila TaxID=446787 RepID=A0A852ZMK2_9ACTN|nr:YceI family protein [Actinopolymorpha rutila]NYH89666.1 polyisoprenoid-binding protein YceI [Actinopolymorpha rutila]